jgi:menaquinone-dependent protoporphyrinogen IX oxidase
MKTLVVYYSRTGVTKKVAQVLSGMLCCDLEGVVDLKNRDGIKGYVIAGKDAVAKRLTEIQVPLKEPAQYDLVIIGTPVWAFTMASAVRSYITRYKSQMKKIAFFCTQGSAGSKATFKDMQELIGKAPEAVLELTTAEVSKDAYGAKLKEFLQKFSHA